MKTNSIISFVENVCEKNTETTARVIWFGLLRVVSHIENNMRGFIDEGRPALTFVIDSQVLRSKLSVN